MKIGLVGCVKSKLPRSAAARDLYTSPLFKGRRRYVERTCDRWFILSAAHGLVAPDENLAPYDQTLTKVSEAERRRWSQNVLGSLEETLGDLRGIIFEIHAGNAYCAHGLVQDLKRRGAQIEMPTMGLPFGKQLAFYRQANTCPLPSPIGPRNLSRGAVIATRATRLRVRTSRTDP